MNSRAILGLAGLSLVGAVIAGYWGFTLSRQLAAAPVVAQTGIVTPAAATPQAAAPQEEDTRQPVVVLLHDVAPFVQITAADVAVEKLRTALPAASPVSIKRSVARPGAACVPEPGSVTKASKPAANWRG
jgi:pilus assembly protein CpaB